MDMLTDNGSLEKNYLETIEQYLEIKFPRDYQNFLLLHNGGEPKEKLFSYKNDPSDGSILDRFFGLVPRRYENLLLYLKQYEARITTNMMPIAADPGGNLILISLKGPDRGKVYFWDHELEADPGQGEVPSYDNMTLIADSFTEFLESLRELPEGYPESVAT